jgi:putative FmdB family regulatory protein
VPTYDYQCDACGRTFEVRQRISEAPLTRCEVCGGAIRRLIAPAPFILKGGGWYVTDYPSAGRKKGMDSEKKAAGSGDSAAGAAAAAAPASAASPASATPAPSAPASAPKD